MKIRVAVEADGPALAAIDAASWSPAVTPAPTPEPGRAFFDARTRPDWVLVAEDGAGAPVGYVKLRPATALPSNDHVLEIQGLDVASHAQGQGVARQLLGAAADHARARGKSRLRLRVLSTNPRAVALYLSCGYRVEGVLRDEFILDGRPVDDLLMALELGPPDPA